MDIHVILNGLRDALAKSIFVRAASVSSNPVDVAPDPRVGGFRPAKNDFNPCAAFEVTLRRKDLFVSGFTLLFLNDLIEVRGDASRVGVVVRLTFRLIDIRDFQARMDERDVFQVLSDDVTVEVDGPKNLLIRLEEDSGSVASKGFHFLDRSFRHASTIGLKIFMAVSMNCRGHLDRKSVDDRRTDPMQAATAGVVLVREFPARVKHREDDLQRRLLVLLVSVDRNPSPVVRDGTGRAVFVKRDFDFGAVTGEVLVDGVVDNLPQKMMQPLAVDTSDVHRRPHPHSLEPFKDVDIAGSVRRFRFNNGCHELSLFQVPSWGDP